MSTLLHKKSILKKTLEVGFWTGASKFLGVMREIFLVRFFGMPGACLDAFLTAFKIPNSLRKIFAEGALSAAFVPTLVRMIKGGDKKAINSLMTLSFIVFEGALLLLCGLIIWQPAGVLRLIVPGWFPGGGAHSLFGILPIPAAWLGYGVANTQALTTIPLLRILASFIIFISSSALLAGALQSVNHFFVSAFSPVLINIIYIGGLIGGLMFGYSASTLSWIILSSGVVQFVLHLYFYFRYHFTFAAIDEKAVHYFKHVVEKFIPSLFSMSIMELNLFIDTSFASYLSVGTVSLVNLGNRFMAIPLSIFAIAISTILLPHFSHLSAYAPKRLHFYLLEATKFVMWAMLPVTVLLAFLAPTIFATLFPAFSPAQIAQAGLLLQVFLIGLFFFSINKILLSVFFAFQDTKRPAIVSVVALVANTIGDYLLLQRFEAVGLVAATVFSGILQTVVMMWLLRVKFNFRFYWRELARFFGRYAIQLALGFVFFLAAFYMCEYLLGFLPRSLSYFLLTQWGFWFWMFPLMGIFGAVLYVTRRWFKVQVYFLD